MTNSKGFSITTVLALLSVVTLAGITAGKAVPSWRDHELRTTATDLAAFLDDARHRSMSHDTPVICRVEKKGPWTVVWMDVDPKGRLQSRKPRLVLPYGMELTTVQPDTPVNSSAIPANAAAPKSALAVFNPRGGFAFGPVGQRLIYLDYGKNTPVQSITAVGIAHTAQAAAWQMTPQGWRAL